MTVKDSDPKKAKIKDLKPILSCINAAESSEQEKKDQKEKKKKFWQKKERKNTPATDDNTIDALKKGKNETSVKSRILPAIKKATTLVTTSNLQKLVSVSAISVAMADGGEKVKKKSCIHHLVQF